MSAFTLAAGRIYRNSPLLTTVLLVLLWVVASLMFPGFGSFGHVRYVLEQAAVMGIVAAGQTLVIVSGGIDLSVGAVMTVSAIVLPLVSLSADPTGLAGVVITLVLTSVIGLINGVGTAFLRVHPMIMTLAMATLLKGVLVLVAGGSAISTSNAAVTWLGMARPFSIPAGIIVWILVSVTVLVLLHGLRIGIRFMTVGANPDAARLSGVNVAGVRLILFTLSGFFAGLAGLLILAINHQGYVGIGDPYLLTSIAAVVLGGTSILGGSGSYAGTIPGSILLVTATALITIVDASSGWRQIILGSVILTILLISGREARA